MADVQGHAALTMTGDVPGTLRYRSPSRRPAAAPWSIGVPMSINAGPAVDQD